MNKSVGRRPLLIAVGLLVVIAGYYGIRALTRTGKVALSRH